MSSVLQGSYSIIHVEGESLDDLLPRKSSFFLHPNNKRIKSTLNSCTKIEKVFLCNIALHFLRDFIQRTALRVLLDFTKHIADALHLLFQSFQSCWASFSFGW